MRVKRGVHHNKRRRNVLAKTKGYRWGRKKKIKAAREAIKHAGKHATIHRRTKKREFRALWQIHVNAGARLHGLTYSTFMHLLKVKNVNLDRKVLAELSENHPGIFQRIVEQVK